MEYGIWNFIDQQLSYWYINLFEFACLQHFKDIMQIRRIDGELLKKMPRMQDSSLGGGEKETGDGDSDVNIVVSRDKCVPVVKGLMALLLSMDFTCNVDLFLITCKVNLYF